MTVVDKANQHHSAGRSRERDEQEIAALLEGLPRYSVAAFILLGERLVMPSKKFLDGRVWHAASPDQDPLLHWVVGCDLGKYQFKFGGVDDAHYWRGTTVIDAYCEARDVVHESKGKGAARGMTTWRLLSAHGNQVNSHPYWISEDALPWTGQMPRDDIVARLRELRFREMYYAGMGLQLEALGVSFTPVRVMDKQPLEDAIAAAELQAETHNLIAAFGLPLNDISPMTESTREALRSLYGPFTVMRMNTQTGQWELLKAHISDGYAYAQTRGTDDALFLQPDGESSQQDLPPGEQNRARTHLDVGGGDAHAFEVLDDGSISFLGTYLGNGTIDLAKPLIDIVFKDHGVRLSEVQAQRALYTGEIRGRAGKTVKIHDSIAKLHAEFDDLLARLEITAEMLTTLIVFTGGGAALLHERIKSKLTSPSMGLQEGTDFIAVPGAIAAITNVAGITVRAIFKAIAFEQEYNEQVLDQLIRAYTSFKEHDLKIGLWNIHQQVTSILEQLYALQNPEKPGVATWPKLKEYRDKLAELRQAAAA